MPAEVLMLGDPRLRTTCDPVNNFLDADLANEKLLLCETLSDFRSRNGFGRGIAAPQIGVMKQFLALALPPLPKLMFNPEIIWSSEETFSMWDDCMSFPFLLVKLRRQKSISVSFQDEMGTVHRLEKLPQPPSELLQHEIDHLIGVLAVDRAQDAESIISRAAFDKNPDYFRKQVDYVI